MRLQLYLLRQLLVALAVSLGGIGFIVVPAVAVSAVNRLNGVSLAAIAGYLPLLLMDLAPYLAPMGFLLATVATFGRLAADNEWTAIRMAGIHPLRTLLPGLLIAAVMALGNYLTLANVTPRWIARQYDYKREVLTNAFRDLNPGRTEIDLGGGRFYLNAQRRSGNTFHKVLVWLPQKERDETLKIVADSASFAFDEHNLMVSFTGARFVQGEGFAFGENITQVIPLESLFARGNDKRESAKFFTSAELRAAIETRSTDDRRLQTYAYEIERRRALSATYFLFLALGAPTGLFLRKGTQLAALATAVGYAFVYYVLSMRLGKELALVGALPAWIGAWATNLLFLASGVWLLRRAVRT